MELFTFNPADATVKIWFAYSASPKDLKKLIHCREHTSLLYVLNGEYRYTFANASFTAGVNSLIYSPAESVSYTYEVFQTNTHPARIMQIEFELLDSATGKPLSFSPHPLALTENPNDEIRTSFETIITNHIKNDHISRLVKYSEFYRLLSLCANCSAESNASAGRRKIAPALNFIQENYRNHFTIAELAELCHISESQLRRIFLAEFGCSPLAYKSELLLRDACNLLKAGEFSVGEISEILGFCDIYAFSHFFRNGKGVSPTVYKAMKNIR